MRLWIVSDSSGRRQRGFRRIGASFPRDLHRKERERTQATCPKALTYRFAGLTFHCTWRSKLIPIRMATRSDSTFCGSISDMIRRNLRLSNQCFIAAAAASGGIAMSPIRPRKGPAKLGLGYSLILLDRHSATANEFAGFA